MFKLAFLATLVLVILKAVGAVTWHWLIMLVPLLAWGCYWGILSLIGLTILGIGLFVAWLADRNL